MSDDDDTSAAAAVATPGPRPSLDPECVLFYAGVKEDVNALLSRVKHEFDVNHYLGFDLFAEQFRAVKFSLIFCGRQVRSQMFPTKKRTKNRPSNGYVVCRCREKDHHS